MIVRRPISQMTTKEIKRDLKRLKAMKIQEEKMHLKARGFSVKAQALHYLSEDLRKVRFMDSGVPYLESFRSKDYLTVKGLADQDGIEFRVFEKYGTCTLCGNKGIGTPIGWNLERNRSRLPKKAPHCTTNATLFTVTRRLKDILYPTRAAAEAAGFAWLETGKLPKKEKEKKP